MVRYLKNYKKEVIIGPIFKLLEAIFELIVPLIMANIIDIGIHNKDVAYIYKMGGVMIALGVGGLACALVCQYFAAKASQGFGTDVRNKLFSHIHSLSHSQIDQLGTSSLVTRMTNDINQLQLAVAMLIRLVIRAPFLVIGATVMAFLIDARLALIFVAAACLIAVVLYMIMSKSVPFYTIVQKLLDRVGLITQENLDGVRVVRAFSRQAEEEDKMQAANDDLEKTSLRVGLISALLNPVTYLIINVSIIAVIWFGGGNVSAGNLQQGEIIALINYLSQILLALVVVANLVIIFTKASASANRVSEVLAIEPSIQDGKPGVVNTAYIGAPKLEWREVYFSYEGSGEDFLEDINLKIQTGQTVGIIGGTGSGKTTLINLIPRFYDVSKGAVLLDGVNVKEYALSELRHKIGIVPQKSQLFSGTIRENMLWGKEDASEEEIIDALKKAQAWEFIDKSKDRLDSQVLQGGKNLSGGQRQRLAIARALIRKPDVLILDDSASALDFATDAALRKEIAKLDSHLTVIMISQRASTLKNADKIVVMDDGCIVGIGSHDELFEANDIYREIYLSQMEQPPDEPKQRGQI